MIWGPWVRDCACRVFNACIFQLVWLLVGWGQIFYSNVQLCVCQWRGLSLCCYCVFAYCIMVLGHGFKFVLIFTYTFGLYTTILFLTQLLSGGYIGMCNYVVKVYKLDIVIITVCFVVSSKLLVSFKNTF